MVNVAGRDCLMAIDRGEKILRLKVDVLEPAQAAEKLTAARPFGAFLPTEEWKNQTNERRPRNSTVQGHQLHRILLRKLQQMTVRDRCRRLNKRRKVRCTQVVRNKFKADSGRRLERIKSRSRRCDVGLQTRLNSDAYETQLRNRARVQTGRRANHAGVPCRGFLMLAVPRVTQRK